MRNRLFALISCAAVIACGGNDAEVQTDSARIADSTLKALQAANAAKRAGLGGAVRRQAFDTAAVAGKRPLLREIYAYEGSDRDPFRPVLTFASRGPELPDLILMSIIYDAGDSDNSVVSFKEAGSNRIYTWHGGQREGRVSVTRVGREDVTLTFNDFGTIRTQTYSLRPSEDVRP